MYPLNDGQNESERLNSQFDILKGEWLTSLFSEPTGTVLDVGCGTGHLYNSIPKDWKYVGIDTTDRFERFSDSQQFFRQDVSEFQTNIKFDVIICRLVLWSLAKRDLVLQRLQKLSHNKTLLYCYEPDDRHLEFSDELLPMSHLAKNWQKTVIPQGSDPFIGGEIDHLLNTNGWTVIAKKQHDHSFKFGDPEFKKHLNNLHRIFSQCDPAPHQTMIDEAKNSIEQENGSFKERYIETVSGLK